MSSAWISLLMRRRDFMENVSSSNSQKDYPQLRLSTVEGTPFPAWKCLNMGDIYKERKAPGNEDLPILTVSIHTGVSDGSLDDSELGKRVKRSEDKSLYKQALTGDLVFNMMRAWQGAVGVVKTPGMVSPAYIVAEPNDEVYPPYMDYLFSTPQMINRIHRLSYGVTDFRLRLYWDSFITIECCIPQLEEQRRVCSFLSEIDHRIDLQRRLVDTLKSYKRGLTLRIFERSSYITGGLASPYPEWRKTTIGEIFYERCEKGRGDEELLAVTISNGVQRRSEIDLKDNSSDDKQNYKIVRQGDIAYNTMRMWQGACGASSYDGIVSPAYTVICPRNADDTCIDFWIYYFKEKHMLHLFQKYSQGLTSDNWNLKYAQLKGIPVTIPCVHEQRRIAALLLAFDARLHTEVEKLRLLEKEKTALLQKMFL